MRRNELTFEELVMVLNEQETPDEGTLDDLGIAYTEVTFNHGTGSHGFYLILLKSNEGESNRNDQLSFVPYCISIGDSDFPRNNLELNKLRIVGTEEKLVIERAFRWQRHLVEELGYALKITHNNAPILKSTTHD